MKTKLIAEILLREAESRWGLRVSVEGDKLAVSPADRCPPEMVELFRQHKSEVLDLLQARADGLPSDCAPWLHVGKQVIQGEFALADRSTLESLEIGLGGVQHPTCVQALAWVRDRLARLPVRRNWESGENGGLLS